MNGLRVTQAASLRALPAVLLTVVVVSTLASVAGCRSRSGSIPPLKRDLVLTYEQVVSGKVLPLAPMSVRVLGLVAGSDGKTERIKFSWWRKGRVVKTVKKGGTLVPEGLIKAIHGQSTVVDMAASHVLGPGIKGGAKLRSKSTTFWISRQVLADLSEDGESTLTFYGRLHRLVVEDEDAAFTVSVDGQPVELRALKVATREEDPKKVARLTVYDDPDNPLILSFDPYPRSSLGWRLTSVGILGEAVQ